MHAEPDGRIIRAMRDDIVCGRADLHIHPSGDAISRRTPMAMYAALAASDLDIAVLADHNRIDVARDLVARSIDDDLRVTLVAGVEIGTRQGHLLGLGLDHLVPYGLSMDDAVAAVHDQGAVAVIAHPLIMARVSAPAEVVTDLAQKDPRRRPDALETMHPTALWLPGWRRRVEQLAESCGYAVVGGSDAHSPRLLGRGRTTFPGSTWTELVEAIGGRATKVEGRRASIRDLLGRGADQLAS